MYAHIALKLSILGLLCAGICGHTLRGQFPTEESLVSKMVESFIAAKELGDYIVQCFEDEDGDDPMPVCPGKEEDHFCDGDGDCESHNDFCDCDAGQAFCTTGVNPCLDPKKHAVTKKVQCFEDEDGDDPKPVWPVCPGKEEGHFCDGDGDCESHNDFCDCDAGQAFCTTGANPCIDPKKHAATKKVAQKKVAAFMAGKLMEVQCYEDVYSHDPKPWPVCPGKWQIQFCDGDRYCESYNCDCDVGQAFCTTGVNPCIDPKKQAATKKVHCIVDEDGDDPKPVWPVCPGKEEGHFCDGDGDCESHNDFCDCDAGQAFCTTGVNPCIE